MNATDGSSYIMLIDYHANCWPRAPDPNVINPLNAELNPICHLLALLGAHHIFHFSRIRVKSKHDSVHNLHLFSRTQHGIILIQTVPLHVGYMFRPLVRPSSGMWKHKSYKGRYNNLRGPCLQSLLFITSKFYLGFIRLFFYILFFDIITKQWL